MSRPTALSSNFPLTLRSINCWRNGWEDTRLTEFRV